MKLSSFRVQNANLYSDELTLNSNSSNNKNNQYQYNIQNKNKNNPNVNLMSKRIEISDDNLSEKYVINSGAIYENASLWPNNQ